MKNSCSEIDKVIAYIHEHIDEPLPLSRLARYAAYSSYHFTRIFKRKTGISPIYYVSSLKIQRAKDLLLHTDLTVRDISMEIGQQSLGTFTTRFTNIVGMTPAQFRKSLMQADNYLQSLKEFTGWPQHLIIESQSNRVEGTIETSSPFQGVILIGLFTKPIPEGFPQYGTLLTSPGPFAFTDVRPGKYYLLATALSWETSATEILVPQQTLRANGEYPVCVEPNRLIPQQRLLLREPRLDDPPILISLPLLMKNFLERSNF